MIQQYESSLPNKHHTDPTKQTDGRFKFPQHTIPFTFPRRPQFHRWGRRLVWTAPRKRTIFLGSNPRVQNRIPAWGAGDPGFKSQRPHHNNTGPFWLVFIYVFWRVWCRRSRIHIGILLRRGLGLPVLFWRLRRSIRRSWSWWLACRAEYSGYFCARAIS